MAVSADNAVRFTKNVKFDRESWDCGHMMWLAVTVIDGDGQPVIRNAVKIPTNLVIRKAVYVPAERIYLNLDAGEKPPVRELEEWEQKEDGMAHERYPIFFNADDMPYYELPAQVIDPGETRPLTRDEMAAAQVDAAVKLYEWCEHVYQAGRLLAEGRVELLGEDRR